jgi:membrane dipeptidase
MILPAAVVLIGLFPETGWPQGYPDSTLNHARDLAQRFIVVDTHVDAPSRLLRGKEDMAGRTTGGNFDFVRAREGGLDVPFMSIYTPSDLEGTGRSKKLADSLIDAVYRLAASAPDKFRVVTSVAEVLRGAGEGRVLFAMGMENGSPLEHDLANVMYFHRRGVRYITLAHAKWNHLADASYDSVRRWGGLSPFGVQVVREMNRVGIMIDISHLSDSAAAQAIRCSAAPVIASHSSCRRFTPGWERNISDELIRAVAAMGGVVHINFGSEFVDDAFRTRQEVERIEIAEHLARNGIPSRSREARKLREEYRRLHRVKYPGVEKVADHIDYVVSLVGVNHVGFGSDFDGVGDTLPVGLKDVSEYPNLIAELLRRGYSEDDIRRVCGGNLLRVWQAVELLAAQLKGMQ